MIVNKLLQEKANNAKRIADCKKKLDSIRKTYEEQKAQIEGAEISTLAKMVAKSKIKSNYKKSRKVAEEELENLSNFDDSKLLFYLGSIRNIPFDSNPDSFAVNTPGMEFSNTLSLDVFYPFDKGKGKDVIDYGMTINTAMDGRLSKTNEIDVSKFFGKDLPRKNLDEKTKEAMSSKIDLYVNKEIEEKNPQSWQELREKIMADIKSKENLSQQ
jgi:hypothetical protein